MFTKFSIKLLFFIPLFLVLITVNYFVDPANIFKSDKFYVQLSNILLSGENIANLSNYDERLLKKYYINGLDQNKDVVVLGSSRAMHINSEFFTTTSFFNASVSSATIEDDIAIYWTMRKKGFIPKIVILGMDPWVFNKFNGVDSYKTLSSEYGEAASHIKINEKKSDKLVSSKYYELLSFSYFQSSIKYLLNNVRQSNKISDFYPTSEKMSDVIIRMNDGSISYDLKYRNRTIEEVRVIAHDFSLKPSMLTNFMRLDPVLISKFEKFIRLLKSDNVTPVIYLAPYHPDAYNLMTTSDQYHIIEVQKYFTEYAKMNGISIVGSYDPKDLGVEEGGFYDAMHEKPESIKKYFFKNNLPYE